VGALKACDRGLKDLLLRLGPEAVHFADVSLLGSAMQLLTRLHTQLLVQRAVFRYARTRKALAPRTSSGSAISSKTLATSALTIDMKNLLLSSALA
jgi:hypothetical protein